MPTFSYQLSRNAIALKRNGESNGVQIKGLLPWYRMRNFREALFSAVVVWLFGDFDYKAFQNFLPISCYFHFIPMCSKDVVETLEYRSMSKRQDTKSLICKQATTPLLDSVTQKREKLFWSLIWRSNCGGAVRTSQHILCSVQVCGEENFDVCWKSFLRCPKSTFKWHGRSKATVLVRFSKKQFRVQYVLHAAFLYHHLGVRNHKAKRFTQAEAT